MKHLMSNRPLLFNSRQRIPPLQKNQTHKLSDITLVCGDFFLKKGKKENNKNMFQSWNVFSSQ